MNVICFDIEGPLSPKDNAYELMKLFPGGGKIFEIISSKLKYIGSCSLRGFNLRPRLLRIPRRYGDC